MSEDQTATLERNIKAGDLRTLLMALVQMTGDLSWLEAPYRPKRDVRLIPDRSAGLSEEARAEIQNALVDVVRSGAEPKLPDPDEETLQRMMSVCLGEDVPFEYSGMVREELGFKDRQVEWGDADEDVINDTSVLIVGAGVSGISLAVALRSLCISFTIVESQEDVGGVWNMNRYPGCGVDTPNYAYAYSFEKNLWSKFFSPREEVLDYLQRVSVKYDLREHIRFSTSLTGAEWDAQQKEWVATLESGGETTTRRARFLVSAIGQLSDPSIPEIDGHSDFSGTIFHSSYWPEDLSVDGKRVAVIGTGATAMQLVPAISDRVEKVTVYQRTPQWSRPIEGYLDEIRDEEKWLLEHLPFYAEWFRFNMFWRYGDGLLRTLFRDPDWAHPERSVNRSNDRHRDELVNFIESEIGDRPELMAKCIPNYPPFGKRILLDNNWYKTLRKPTVELVDEPIDHIGTDHVETADGVQRQADIVVYCTGFKTTELASRLGIVGRDGVTLAEAWGDENPTAYLGMAVEGFPNFFTMIGPNSGPAHGGSVVFQAECQTRYMTSLIVKMLEQGADSFEVKPDVLRQYVGKVDAEHEKLIWTHPGVDSYYKNRHGRVISVMPWRFVDYWQMTHDVDLTDYEFASRGDRPRPASSLESPSVA